MAGFSDKARRTATKVKQANVRRRRVLAKQFDLRPSDFMPKVIRATMAAHNIPGALVHPALLPKEKPKPKNGANGHDSFNGHAKGQFFPLDIIPERPNGKGNGHGELVTRLGPSRSSGTAPTAREQIAMGLLTVMNKLLS